MLDPGLGGTVKSSVPQTIIRGTVVFLPVQVRHETRRVSTRRTGEARERGEVSDVTSTINLLSGSLTSVLGGEDG